MAKILDVYPYLRLRGGLEAITFYRHAFDGEELMRLVEPGGRLGHAEVRIGNTVVMLSDEYPEYDVYGPQTRGGTTVALHLHVDNLDSALKQAVAAGASVVREPQDHFYGERSATIRDPFGHEWLLGQEIEKVTPEEMQRRYTELFSASTTLKE
ncbi:MAG: VOC family protein [Bryobacterales bacterium]|nr:VOC family protein [Bryobacterales bacterium]